MLFRATCAGFALAAAGTAAACGGAVGFASDNVLRGASLSDERPAWLVDAHCEPARDWVAGVAASRVHLVGRSANVQWSAYVDRRWQFGQDWSAKAGATHYDAARRAGIDGLRYDEVNAAIGYRGRWRASIAFAPNATDVYYRGKLPPAPGLPMRRYRAYWLESTMHQPLGDGRFAIDAGAGIAFPGGDHNSRYRYGSIGLRWQLGDAAIYATHVWTGAIRWRVEWLGQTYEMALPPRSAWVGTILWAF